MNQIAKISSVSHFALMGQRHTSSGRNGTMSRNSKVPRQEAHRGDGNRPLGLPWCTRTRMPKKISTEQLTAKINSVVPESLLQPDSSLLRESQKLIINRNKKQGLSWKENSSGDRNSSGTAQEQLRRKFFCKDYPHLAKAGFNSGAGRALTRLISWWRDVQSLLFMAKQSLE